MRIPNIWLMISVVIVFICAQTITTNIKAEKVNLATFQQARSVLIDLLNVETAVRGYVINGKPEYLEPYNKSVDLIVPETDELIKITADDPTDNKTAIAIKQYAVDKVSYLKQVIELKKNGDERAVDNESQKATGKGYMDEIRKRVETLSKKHNDLFVQSQVDSLHTLKRLKIALTLLVVASLAESIYKYYRFRRRQKILKSGFISNK